MRVNYPGLLIEKLPSGNVRIRVRVEGNPRRRVRLHVSPDHKDFNEHYLAARRGIAMKPDVPPAENAVRGSIAWLTHVHLEDMEKSVAAGLMSPMTLKKRVLLLERLRRECGDFALNMPTAEVVRIRDSLADTPAWADSLVEAVRVLYRWAIERGLCDVNPAAGVGRIDRGKGGAKPWTVDDLHRFREHHRPGTTAHLCLTLLTFTACRIGDAVTLGRHNEFERDGARGLGWQPRKKGSAYVEIPMLPPLYKATRATGVQGPTYLLTARGRPFASPDALGQHVRRWCREAGLVDRTAHGIRKAAGHLLAQEGCTQYQIMCIHGHTQARTSEVYTKGVERWKMAVEAMQTLAHLDW